MQTNNVRRAQLVIPFGPGALQVLRNGVTVITAGLDHWFETNAGVRVNDNDLSEFKVREWRLEQMLNVDYFMVPPEYRVPALGGEARNVLLTIPVLRFPKWYLCSQCGRMEEKNLDFSGYAICPDCKRRMAQVRFIAMCDGGHIQDFPWIEWVHRSPTLACRGPLKYTASGGGSLFSIKISCLTCKKERTLESITSASASGESTYLSSNLLSSPGNSEPAQIDAPYLCRGRRPWLGTDSITACNRPMRAALRSATNVYYADIKSSIYLPVVLYSAKNNALETLKKPEIKTYLNISKELFSPDVPDTLVQGLRKKYKNELEGFGDSEIKTGIEIIWDIKTGESVKDKRVEISGEDRWVTFRRMEYGVLSTPHREDDLITIPGDISGLSPGIRKHIDKIYLVERLRETRVLAGFTRVVAESGMDPVKKQSLLRRKQPPKGHNWLPAYIVYGEGIFLNLQEDILRHWEEQLPIKKRVENLDMKYRKVCEERQFPVKRVTPRLVLLHTLAHLLMNRLTFECGYSSAALRERLYAADNREAPMAGILIYTSSGDSEGTLGGLVRMGKPENFEPLFLRALEAATWCSADPVCSEMGNQGGQGPDSCNLAACHCCCLVPETACEEFNRFLDRSLVIDNHLGNKLGYFKDI